MDEHTPSVDLAVVFERWSPILPYALMGAVVTFFSFVAVFGG